MQLATLAMACRSICDTCLTAGGWASESMLSFGASGAGWVSAETQITPFKPKISWTPAGKNGEKMQQASVEPQMAIKSRLWAELFAQPPLCTA